ncbi:Transducin (beta)-like 3 [Entophlyctis luteolus]|nr:Transducin (beta)-like 3 [Entophlyctis luteolus]
MPVDTKTNLAASRVLDPFYTGGHAHAATSVGGVAGARGYVLAGVDGAISVMDVDSGALRATIKGEDADEFTCFACAPDGLTVVTAARSLLLAIVKLDFAPSAEATTTRDSHAGAVKTMRTWKAHDAPVLTMAFDASSTLVATGSADSTIRIWDVDRGFATHLFKGHSGVISALAFSNPVTANANANSILLASASDDCKVRIWDLEAKRCLHILDNHVSVVRGVAFSASGSFLVSGGRDKILNLWDVRSGQLVKTVPTQEAMEAVGLVPEQIRRKIVSNYSLSTGALVAYTGGEKGALRLWDLSGEGKVVAQPEEQDIGSDVEISQILVLETQLIAVTSDHNFLFYDAFSSKLPRTHQIIGYNEEVVDLQFATPTQNCLAVASNSPQIKLMHLESSRCDVLYGHSGTVLCLDVSADGAFLASGSKDRSAIVWRFTEDENGGSFSKAASCLGHVEAVGAVAFSKKANSARFLVTGSQDRTIKVWDCVALDKTKHVAPNLKTSFTFLAHDKDINAISVAPNDKIFASGSQDKTAKIWSATDGSLLGTCTGHRRGVWSVQFSTIDKVLATASADKTIRLWSLSDYSCVKTFEGHLNSVLKVSFLSLGTQLVSSGSDGLVKLWNIKNAECVGTFDNHEDKIWALAVRFDEDLIISGGADSRITVWRDCTAEDRELADRELTEKVEKEQDFLNFLQKKDYKNAIVLAMELDKPMRLLQLFKEVKKMRTHSTSATGLHSVDNFIRSLEGKQLEQLLGYIKDWNTHTKHAHIAQQLLYLILNQHSASKLMETKKIKDLLESLLVYSERHYGHLDDLLKQSFFLSYTLDQMDDMLGGEGEI